MKPCAGAFPPPAAPAAAGASCRRAMAWWPRFSLERMPAAMNWCYDARHEATPRPHFLGEWLRQSSGTVELVRDELGCCRGFGRIRPCLLPDDAGALGWRLGPLLADAPLLAGALLDRLCSERTGPVLIDAPEANPRAHRLLEQRGFQIAGRTVRMYCGTPPELPLQDIYGLACLELG